MLYNYRATITGIHDGDTITVDIDLGFGVVMKAQRIRLYGINAPELNTPEGVAALTALKTVLSVGQTISVETKKQEGDKEKYGRWLGTVMAPVNGTVSNVNVWMVAGGFAKPFMQYASE